MISYPPRVTPDVIQKMGEIERHNTEAEREAYKEWWNDICRKGDPLHRPNLVREAFAAGFWESFKRGRTS